MTIAFFSISSLMTSILHEDRGSVLVRQRYQMEAKTTWIVDQVCVGLRDNL